jgi:hypothetical protein
MMSNLFLGTMLSSWLGIRSWNLSRMMSNSSRAGKMSNSR